MRKLAKIKSRIEKAIECEFLGKGDLFQAVSYSLRGGGKRVRPIIVLLVADALNNGLDVMSSALSCEFFHTASLIVDDLPCMDNDDLRRDRPSLHKAFGETTAILASYALISEAFSRIEKNGKIMKSEEGRFSTNAYEATSIALECASRCAGIKGATLGQYFDLKGKIETISDIEEVIYLKTITLFEGAFVLGWVFGGGDLKKLEDVKQLAFHFGMAFQVRDDLHDIDQDKGRAGSVNFAISLGEKEARNRFYKEVAQAEIYLRKLSINSSTFQLLLQRLSLEP